MKRKITFLSLFASLLCISPHVMAQDIKASGKVSRSSGGDALPSATVTVKETGKSTVTDQEGTYTILLPQNGGTLTVSFTGMQTQTLKVKNSGTYNYQLISNESSTLEDVVVVGYGTQKVTKVSGAISTVKAETLDKLKPVRVDDALQGTVSGVNVIQSGSPGAKPTVLIRGIPSFSGVDPVVIVDGIPQTLDDLNSINPADVESITVLKDAATTAIYGVKGGNGVILVTTKGGRKNQKTQFTLGANYGIQEVANTIGVLNATEYAAIINEGSTVAGGPVIFPDLSGIGKGTNWQNEIFHQAPLQTYSLGARGGSDKTTYFLSAGFLQQGGIVGGSDKSNFTRGTFTANVDYEITKRLKFIMNTTGVIIDSKGVQENSFNSIIGSALNFDPTVTVLNEDPNAIGKYGYSNLLLSEIFNPLTKLDNTYNKNTGSKIYGKFEAQYKILKDLKLSSRFGYTKYDDNGKSFTPLVFYGPLNVENTLNADGSTVLDKHNSVSHAKNSNFNFTWETFANYDFNVKENHHFQTVLGFSLAKTSGNSAGASKQDVPFNSWDFADFTAATGANTATNSNALSGYYYQYERRNISYFGRLNYDYNEKYLASFTARRDGSMAFGPDNKYANFFSGSAGWIVSKEDFFHSNFINYLKLRGSYGTVGNENVSPSFVSIITGGPSYGSTANSNGYTFGGVFYPGATVGSIANTALRWEEQTQFNIGFDVSMAKNKLNLSADYFQKKVKGLLFQDRLSLYTGTLPPPDANIGTTKSSGVDLTLSYNEIIGNNFTLGNSFTFTTSKNEVISTNSDGTAKIQGGGFFNGQSQTVTVFEKGFTPGYFYGYKTLGLFQNAAEIANAPLQANAVPGDVRFADINGDSVIDASDRTKIGDPFPDFTIGWNLSASYKGFDINVFTYASVGNDIYRAYERNANYSNKFRSVLGRWTGEGSTNNANNPRYSFTDANSNIRVSDRYVEDGSFVKIKNIVVGYTFPKSVTGKIFNGLRIYGQVRNAYTFTKYSGYDPEISGGVLNSGIDRGAYPQARTYSVGLDIKL